MLFKVSGYKCLKNELSIDLSGKIYLLWGPMGAGKSSVLESLTILLDILNENFSLVKDGSEHKIENTSLSHLMGLSFNELVTLIRPGERIKEMKLSLEEYGCEAIVSRNTDSGKWSITFKAVERDMTKLPISEIKDLEINTVIDFFKAMRRIWKEDITLEHAVKQLNLDEKEKHELKTITTASKQNAVFRNFIDKVLELGKVVYVSAHRPSPSELRFEPSHELEYEWSSKGEHIPHKLYELICRRVSRKQSLQSLEERLKDLGVTSDSPAIEYVGRDEIKVGGRDLRVLSSGERNTLLLLLAVEETPQNGFLIIEEPELGLHVRNFSMLLEEICKTIIKKATLILSTHSPIPLRAISTLVMNNQELVKKVRCYYVSRRDYRVEMFSLPLDERGRISLTPDVRDMLREEVDIESLRRIFVEKRR